MRTPVPAALAALALALPVLLIDDSPLLPSGDELRGRLVKVIFAPPGRFRVRPEIPLMSVDTRRSATTRSPLP